MKYWNRDKNFRRTWPSVNPPAQSHVEDAKRWCQHHPSNGRFYFHYTNTRWWFERESDAVLFAMKWSR